MKTIIRHGLLGAALLLCAALHAQNVQFHYDFGRAAYDRLGDRPLWTTTVDLLGNQPRTEILGRPALGSSRI